MHHPLKMLLCSLNKQKLKNAKGFFLMQICPPQGCLHIFTQAEVNYVLDQATHIPEYPTRG